MTVKNWQSSKFRREYDFAHYEVLGRDVSPGVAEKMCLSKKQFDTKNAARDWASVGQRMYGNAAANVYKCSICKKFHLTTIPKSQQPKAKKKAKTRSNRELAQQA